MNVLICLCYRRETIKLAIVYVGPGQEDEQSIFRNERGSAEYEEFVSTLGWEVCIAFLTSRRSFTT